MITLNIRVQSIPVQPIVPWMREKNELVWPPPCQCAIAACIHGIYNREDGGYFDGLCRQSLIQIGPFLPPALPRRPSIPDCWRQPLHCPIFFRRCFGHLCMVSGASAKTQSLQTLRSRLQPLGHLVRNRPYRFGFFIFEFVVACKLITVAAVHLLLSHDIFDQSHGASSCVKFLSRHSNVRCMSHCHRDRSLNFTIRRASAYHDGQSQTIFIG